MLGAFNPGMARLPNGNLLLMVRVAEALDEPVKGDVIRAIRWTPEGYRLDDHRLDPCRHDRSAPVRAARPTSTGCSG